MAVPSTPYAPDVSLGNGATNTFPYQFRILADEHLVVEVDGVALSYPADYYATGVGDESGGDAVLTVPPAVNAVVVRRRVTTVERQTQYQNLGDLLSTTHNADHDAPILMLQEVNETFTRALYTPPGETDGASTFDARGNRITGLASGVDPTDAATVEQIVSAGSGNFIASGTGAQIRTMQDKVREVVSVLDYGAVGDGVTSDTAAFDLALAAADKVFVPPTAAGYCLDDLSIPSGKTLYGERTLLKPHTIGASYVLAFAGGATDAAISGFVIQAPKATYPAKIVIVGGSAVRCRVTDCEIVGGAYGILFVSSTDCTAERNTVSGFVESGISFGTASTRSRVLGNKVNGSGSAQNSIEVIGGTRCTVDSNDITEAGVFGLFVSGSENCVVSNNQTYNTIREGINLNASVNCQIIDNNVSFPVGGFSTDFGISVWGTGAVSRNNLISGNTVTNSYLSGIGVAGDVLTVSDTLVVGNSIINCGRSNLADTAGVVVYGTGSLRSVVLDNNVYDDAGVLKYGVFDDPVVGAPVGSIIRGNKVQGAATATVSRSSTSIEAMNGRTLRSWTPVVTASSGTITTLGTVVGRYYEVEKMVFVSITIPITTNGTGAGALLFTLPFTASANPAALCGREGSVTGYAVTGIIAASATQAALRMYDNAYPGGNGREIIVAGWYERA